MARHLGKHIPGNPHLVFQNIPGCSIAWSPPTISTTSCQRTGLHRIVDPQHIDDTRDQTKRRPLRDRKIQLGGSLASGELRRTSLANGPHKDAPRSIPKRVHRRRHVWSRSRNDTADLQRLDRHQIQNRQRVQRYNGHCARHGASRSRWHRRLVVEQLEDEQTRLAERPKGPHPSPGSTDQKSRLPNVPFAMIT